MILRKQERNGNCNRNSRLRAFYIGTSTLTETVGEYSDLTKILTQAKFKAQRGKNMILKSGSNIIASGSVGKVDYKEVGESNKPLTTVGLAVGRKDGTTIWMNCNFWGNHAGIASGFEKGDTLFVTGNLTVFKTNTGKEYEQCQVEYYSVLGKNTEPQKAEKKNITTDDLNPIEDDDFPF